MKSVFEVEIYAMAVGAVGESSVGAIRHVLEIVTETSILHLPITANILFHFCDMFTVYVKHPIRKQMKASMKSKVQSL